MRWIWTVLAILFIGFTPQAQSVNTEWVGMISLPDASEVVLRINPSEGWVFIHQPTHIYRVDLINNQFDITSGETTTQLRITVSGDSGVDVLSNGANFALSPVVPLDEATLMGYTGTYQSPDETTYLIYRFNGVLRYATTTHIVRLFALSETTFLSGRGEMLTFAPDGLTLTHAGESIQLQRQDFYQTEDMTVQNGEVSLSGTLYRPIGVETPPLLVITHGSSPNLRSGYQVEAFWFASRGIAAFIYDKRGNGLSNGDSQASLYDLGGDAVAAAQTLRELGDFGTISVWGLSQGASVSAVAAGQAPDVIDGVVAVSGSGVPFIQQELYRVDRLAADLGYAPRLREMSLTFWRVAYDLQTATAKGQFPDIGFRDTLGFEIDLAALWAELRQPSLIIYGGRDSYVPVMDSAARLMTVLEQTAHPDYQLHLYPEANHGMLVSPTGSSLVFSDTVSDGYVDQMVEWVIAQDTSDGLEATQVDFEAAESGDFSAGERYAVPTITQGAAVQIGLLIGLIIVFIIGVFGVRSSWLVGVSSALALTSIGGVLYVISMTIYPQQALTDPIASFLYTVSPILAWLTCIAFVLLLIRSPFIYRQRRWGLRLHLSATLLAGLGYGWWAWYWGLLSLA